MEELTASKVDDIISADSNTCYTYHRYEKLIPVASARIPPNIPVRFLISKGNDGKRTQLSPYTVHTTSATFPRTEDSSNDDGISKNNGKYKFINNDRIQIKYPSGKTYFVRKSFILPIYYTSSCNENNVHNRVFVAPETNHYRKLCQIHTLPNDMFIEIGSDFGFNIGIIPIPDGNKIGIDKSETSNQIAKNNYDRIDFMTVDVLLKSQEWFQELFNIMRNKFQNHQQDNNNISNKEQLCEDELLIKSHLVVAIDINGNREIEAVVECLKRVMNWWSPKLIIVKSRSLYKYMQEKGIGDSSPWKFDNTS